MSLWPRAGEPDTRPTQDELLAAAAGDGLSVAPVTMAG